MRIVKDQNGNHVVQKAITLVPRMCIPFIMNSFRGHITTFATHGYGCRIIQRILESGTEEEKRELLDAIHASLTQLINDQYGNYVTQHVLEKGPEAERSRMVEVIYGQLIEFSTHKYASNVVESAIEYGSEDQRRAIKAKLMTVDSNGQHPLDKVMLDQFGNYVMRKLDHSISLDKLRLTSRAEKMAKHLSGEEKADLLDEMERRFLVLKKSANSRQVGAIERSMEKYKQANNVNAKTGTSQPTGRKTPAEIHLDVNTTATTPALTSENSSPKSASSPSTKSGDETISSTGKVTTKSALGAQPGVVDVDGVEG